MAHINVMDIMELMRGQAAPNQDFLLRFEGEELIVFAHGTSELKLSGNYLTLKQITGFHGAYHIAERLEKMLGIKLKDVPLTDDEDENLVYSRKWEWSSADSHIFTFSLAGMVLNSTCRVRITFRT